MKLSRLFTPITINGLQLKNRLVMPAIHHLYTPDGFANERNNQYYWTRAEGGVGLIIVGGCRFDDYGYSKDMMSLHTDEHIPGWKTFTDGIHSKGCKIGVQLYHAGRYAKTKNLQGKQALSPSGGFCKYTNEISKEMSTEELKEIIRTWAEGAIRAKKAGFDAVEILASAGYLISQFLSPLTNKRTDEYGGSWENRCRFTLEVIAAIRAAVGENYPLMMRIAGNDFVEGGNNNSHAVEYAKLIEQAGIDMIDVTGGWHETKVPQLPGEVPRAGYSYLAAAIKAAVSIPVMVSNRINDPIVGEEILALERGDLIGLGRTLIADPDWVNKARDGKFDEIKRCVACNQGCLAKTFFGKPIECLINGSAGKEYLMKKVGNNTQSKNILVVGAGPGGCEFAIKAAEFGHKITIWEKEAEIGGQLSMVAMPPGKVEFANLIKYYKTMLQKLSVHVEYNKKATAKEIIEQQYDTVVIAAGVNPKVIKLPCTSNDISIHTANEVLSQYVIPGKNVMVIGGGSVGCETAQYLAHRGSLSPKQLYFLMAQNAEDMEKINSLLCSSDRNIAIVEITGKIGAGFELGTGWPILKDLKRLGVKQYTNTKILDVGTDKVILEVTNKDSSVETVEVLCDSIVLAVGSTANNELYEQLKDKVAEIYNIGDSREVGKILDAIRDASALATHISQ